MELIAEFAAHLEDVARRHAGNPRDELDELWRIGLEREAIVTVAYRHDRIVTRLAKMPLDDDARAVVARAIRWAWRDEQAHALWIRGAHMRWTEAAFAMAAETRGKIGGWMSSEQHNVRWRDAPFGRAIAEAIELLGAATGSVPSAVRRSLKFSSFANVCTFNHGAETTAAMAWRRMADLATAIDDDDARRGFSRMAEDEDRHAKVFAILRDAFSADDRLVIPTTELRARLHEVGARFIAKPDATAPAWKNPLGKGGTVVVRDGEDPTALVASALEAAGVTVEPGATVALKTTFMLVTHPAERSPGVSPAILDAVVAWFEARGACVKIVDARNLYDRFLRNRDVQTVADRLGIRGDIVDAQDDQVPHAYTRGLGVDTLCKTWRDADVRILLGKLRSHPTSTALLALEAAEGLGARHDDLLFLERRAERETAMLMALDAAPPHVSLLDAWSDVPDGLMGVLGDDRPLQPRRLYAARDAVALDAVVCRHIGAAPDRGGMLVDTAFDWFGDPRNATVVDGPGTPIEGFRLPDHSPRTAVLAALALPMFTLASGRGALFVPKFDAQTFPAIRPSRVLDAARTIIARIVDDTPRDPRGASPLPTRMIDTAVGAVRVARIGTPTPGTPPLVCLHGYPETLQIWSALLPRLDGVRREAVMGSDPFIAAASGQPDTRQNAALGDRTIDDGYDARVRPTGQEAVMGSDPFIAACPNTGRECIAFDWPGLGHSGPVLGSAPVVGAGSIGGDASPQALAEHLRAVLDALGLERVDLLAGDMGVPPALVFAAMYPERVRRVTCTSSLLFHDAKTSIEISIMRRANLASAAFSIAPKIVYARSKQSMLDGELPAAIDRDFQSAFAKKSVRDRLAKMCAAYENALPELPSIYWKLRCPVHLLWAEHDRHFGIEHAERLCAIVPTAKLDVIEGAKHWMAFERSGELAVHL